MGKILDEIKEKDLNKLFKDLDDIGVKYIKKDVKEKWQNYCDQFSFYNEIEALEYMSEEEYELYIKSEDFIYINPFPSIFEFMEKNFQ